MSLQQSLTSFFKNFFATAPVIFPLIALFHIGLLLYICFTFFDPGISFWYWLRPLIIGLYTWFWISACYLKKKGATAYLILTIIMVCFFFFGPDGGNNLDGQGFLQDTKDQLVILRGAIGDILIDPLPANILFSFIILLYYRRMKPKHANPEEDLVTKPQ